MKNSIWSRTLSIASIALLVFSVLSCRGEQKDLANQKSPAACLKDFETAYGTRYRALQIMNDPGTGRRWLLVEQLDRPEAPALLMLMPDNHACSKLPIADSEWRYPSAHRALPVPVISPGDSIILSEASPVSDGRLEAIALERAATGQELTVRLKLGGHLLRAVAIGSGRATLLAHRNEVRR
jgi:hypothetical protein